MKRQINFTLNGKEVTANVSPNETLLDVLRDKFQLGGAKETCGLGLCGVCTVMVSGNPVSSCLYFAAAIDEEDIITIEGIDTDAGLHPIQQAFLNKKAFQCGYCTPGMIMMAMKLLEENESPTEEEIKEYMVGNICRCASYAQILEAIIEAAELIRIEKIQHV
jgi:carbon-monoxide dehydrogenase small subunit